MSQQPAFSQAPKSQRTTNPFLLPSHTKQGFLILIFGAFVFVIQVSMLRSGGAVKHWATLFEQLMKAANQPERNYSTAAPYAERFAVDLLTIVAFFSVLLIARYYFHPWSIRIRDTFAMSDLGSLTRLRLRWGQMFGGAEDPKLTEELRGLSETAQIHSPRLELGHNWNLRTAQAFGFPPFAIRLEPGFRVFYRSNPKEARAVLLHELGHIRNGDIRRGWLAATAVQGPIALAATLLVNNALGLSFFAPVTELGVETYVLGLGTAALLLYFYSRFLRAREVYADCRARLWGAGEALYTILEDAVRAGSDRRRGPLSLHPSAATRIGHLAHPELLFEVSALDMFGLGALLGIAFPSVEVVLVLLVVMFNGGTSAVKGMTNGRFVTFLALFVLLDLVFSYAVMATAGVAIQRRVMEAFISKEKKGTGWKNLIIAFSLAVGFCVSTQLITLANGTAFALRIVKWVVISTTLLWLVIIYLQFTIKRACKHVTSEKSCRRRAFLITVLGTLMLSGLFPFLVSLTMLVPTESFLDEYAMIVGLCFGLFGMVYICLWILTMLLVALAWRSKVTQCPNCHALHSEPATFGSTCRSCNVEITPWATIKWPGDIETASKIVSESSVRVTLEMDDENELRALSGLEDEMINDLAGQNMTTATVCEIFNGRHSEVECLKALKFLERTHAIIVDPDLRFRDSSTIPSTAVIYFPKQKKRTLRSVGAQL